MRGYTLLPVVLAMSLIGAIAFMLNRDNGLSANLIGSRSDLSRARYAAEAGLQAVNYTIQGLGCAGGYPISSSPVTDASFGGGAFSAYAASTSGSPLTLTSTGTYNGASVTLTKTNAYVYQSGVRTWVTQPGPATGKDAMVDKQNPTRSYGGVSDLQVDKDEKQTLIAFDLSPLPAGSRIVRWYQAVGGLQPGATLSLYQTGAGINRNFSVMLITHDWTAGSNIGLVPTPASPGVTWNRWDGISPNDWPQGPGNGYDPRTLVVVPETLAVGWINIDVTEAALGWASGVYPNYGLWLAGTSDTRNYRFTASDDTTPIAVPQRPKLTVSYLLPCGAAAPA